VLAAVLAALAGTWAIGAARDTYEVAKMTERMKTVCVGRMLIDLPTEAKVHLYGARIHGFDIETFVESPEAFRARVAAREAEIRAKPDRFGESKNMESVRDVKTDSGLAGKIFVHGRNVEESTAGYSIETFRRIRYEGVDLEAHVHGGGISIDMSAKDYDPDRVENLPKLVAQLVANPGNSIPVEPGFCVDRAYVRDPLKAEQREQIVLSAGLPSRPDIEIRFDTLAGTKPDSKGLLARNAASHARAPAIVNMRFTNLRAAPRTIGGLTGGELVERVVEENFAIIYGFEWEVNGTEDNVFVPDVTLRMATGQGPHGPVQSSLSQPAALSLWDKISSSVRVRPTAPPKANVAAPPSPAIGTTASAGETCPRSGWWQCREGGNGVGVLRGQRQYIKQGQRMPQALLLPPQTLWERIRGIQPGFESDTPTAWKLVDKRSRARIVSAVKLEQAKVVTPAAIAAVPGAGTVNPPPIGSYLTTGSPCPASGWWRCEESHALDGARWFAYGSLLPAATFAVPPTSFGNRPGTPKTIQRRATWQLVRLAQAPELARSGDSDARGS
jgi:hypothetical protein